MWTAKLCPAPPAGALLAPAGLQGWGAGRWGPLGRVAARGGAGGARVNPPLPRPPAFPFPRVPRADPRPLLSPPLAGRRLLLSPTEPPVPLVLPAAGLAGPAGPGQAAVFSPQTPPPCWPLAHPTGGPTAPQPPVGAPAPTRVGGGGWERGSWCGRAPRKRLFCGGAPRERRGRGVARLGIEEED